MTRGPIETAKIIGEKDRAFGVRDKQNMIRRGDCLQLLQSEHLN